MDIRVNFVGAKYHMHGPRGYGLGPVYGFLDLDEESPIDQAVVLYVEENYGHTGPSLPVVEPVITRESFERIARLQADLAQHIEKEGDISAFPKAALLEFDYGGRGYTYRYWVIVTEADISKSQLSQWERVLIDADFRKA